VLLEGNGRGVQALAKHCPSLESVNLWWCARALQQCTESLSVHRALRGATIWCARTLLQCTESLSFLLRILSEAAKAPWRPAPEGIRSKNERLSA